LNYQNFAKIVLNGCCMGVSMPKHRCKNCLQTILRYACFMHYPLVSVKGYS
jgi:hypothetical protein